MKAKVIFLVVFLGIGGTISYHQMAKQDRTFDAAVATEEPQVFASSKDGDEVRVEQYFYAVETYDKVLVPLVYVSEVLREEDVDRLIFLSETTFSQMNAKDADAAVDIIMEFANRDRIHPVWIEVIRVSE